MKSYFCKFSKNERRGRVNVNSLCACRYTHLLQWFNKFFHHYYYFEYNNNNKTNSWDTKKNSNTTNENNENSAKWRDQKKIGKEKGNKSAFDLKFDSELNPISTYDDTLFRKKIQKKMIQKLFFLKLLSSLSYLLYLS